MNEFQTQFVVAIARNYASCFHPRAIHPVDSAQSFSGAKLYHLETPAGRYCARGWGASSYPLERIQGLHALLQHVFENGMPHIALPVKTVQGRTLFEWNHQFWHIEPWITGSADYDAIPNRDKLDRAMAALARWHLAASTWQGQSKWSEWFFVSDGAISPTVLERIERLAQWRGKPGILLCERVLADRDARWHDVGTTFFTLFARHADNVRHELSPYANIPLPLQPCLRDIWSAHVFYQGNDVTGLIDPTAARSDNVAIDLARLLGSMVGDDRSGWQAGLDAYRLLRPLDAVEERLIGPLDRSGLLLSGMNWLDRHIHKPKSIRNEDAAFQRFSRIVSRMRNLPEP